MSTDLFSLEGKKYLVTGASSGIGYETCLMINKTGGSFIGVARRENELKKLLTESGNKENKTITADLTIDGDVDRLVESLPVLDGLVHSAGMTVPHVPLKFYKKEALEKVRAINFDAIVFLMSKLVKDKKLKNGGSVVMVASIAGLFGTKGAGIYAASKGALIAITRVWASELALSGIRVNAVAPGMVRTELTLNTISELSAETIAEDEKKYPLGYGNPVDVAGPIIFLLSPAGKWITGETMIIDGGRTMTV